MCPSGGTKHVSFDLFLGILRGHGEGRGGAPGTIPLQNPQVTSRKACSRNADKRKKKTVCSNFVPNGIRFSQRQGCQFQSLCAISCWGTRRVTKALLVAPSQPHFEFDSLQPHGQKQHIPWELADQAQESFGPSGPEVSRRVSDRVSPKRGGVRRSVLSTALPAPGSRAPE